MSVSGDGPPPRKEQRGSLLQSWWHVTFSPNISVTVMPDDRDGLERLAHYLRRRVGPRPGTSRETATIWGLHNAVAHSSVGGYCPFLSGAAPALPLAFASPRPLIWLFGGRAILTPNSKAPSHARAGRSRPPPLPDHDRLPGMALEKGLPLDHAGSVGGQVRPTLAAACAQLSERHICTVTAKYQRPTTGPKSTNPAFAGGVGKV